MSDKNSKETDDNWVIVELDNKILDKISSSKLREAPNKKSPSPDNIIAEPYPLFLSLEQRVSNLEEKLTLKGLIKLSGKFLIVFSIVIVIILVLFNLFPEKIEYYSKLIGYYRCNADPNSSSELCTKKKPL